MVRLKRCSQGDELSRGNPVPNSYDLQNLTERFFSHPTIAQHFSAGNIRIPNSKVPSGTAEQRRPDGQCGANTLLVRSDSFIKDVKIFVADNFRIMITLIRSVVKGSN